MNGAHSHCPPQSYKSLPWAPCMPFKFFFYLKSISTPQHDFHCVTFPWFSGSLSPQWNPCPPLSTTKTFKTLLMARPEGHLFSSWQKYKNFKTYPELDGTWLNMHMFGRWLGDWRPTILEDQQGIHFMWSNLILTYHRSKGFNVRGEKVFRSVLLNLVRNSVPKKGGTCTPFCCCLWFHFFCPACNKHSMAWGFHSRPRSTLPCMKKELGKVLAAGLEEG
jgi:hypothetical protein